MPDFETYQSPFTWRYGSLEMRRIWSEAEKRRLWRTIWAALAEAQSQYGLATLEQVQDLKDHIGSVHVERALEIEAEIHHDLMAELRAFAEQARIGGKILHQGATSTDIEDNADALRILQALDLLLEQLDRLLVALAERIIRWAEMPVMAYTHLQPAEPSTLGYRLAQYGQDLLFDHQWLLQTRAGVKGKGFKGAVGTSAAYAELVGKERLQVLEDKLSQLLGLPFFPVSTQTYPRKQDYFLLSAVASIGGSLYKFAFDMRLLQSPSIGEWAEPFGRKQVGSSAMPFKRNPINAEKIDSLARMLAQYPRLAWDNAAHSLLERTLDDSANRRTMLPEAFLIADELILTALKIVEGMRVDDRAIARNLGVYGPFAATERVLMALSKAGADRQAMHERLRGLALTAWEAVGAGQPNPLETLLAADQEIGSYLPEGEIHNLMDVRQHLGDAPERAKALARRIRETITPQNRNPKGNKQ
jgi:adenylosuccinate lyase